MQNYQFTLIALIDFSKLAIQAGSNTEKSVIRFNKCLLVILQRGVSQKPKWINHFGF